MLDKQYSNVQVEQLKILKALENIQKMEPDEGREKITLGSLKNSNHSNFTEAIK